MHLFEYFTAFCPYYVKKMCGKWKNDRLKLAIRSLSLITLLRLTQKWELLRGLESETLPAGISLNLSSCVYIREGKGGKAKEHRLSSIIRWFKIEPKRRGVTWDLKMGVSSQKTVSLATSKYLTWLSNMWHLHTFSRTAYRKLSIEKREFITGKQGTVWYSSIPKTFH